MTKMLNLAVIAAIGAAPAAAFAQETTISVWDEFGAEPQRGAMENIVAHCEEPRRPRFRSGTNSVRNRSAARWKTLSHIAKRKSPA